MAGLVITSVLFMAMPLALVGGAFSEAWQGRDKILLMQKTRHRLKQFGFTAYDIPVLFSTFTNSQEEELDFQHFREMMVGLRIGLSKTRTAELFRSLDTDRGGTIDAREFVQHIFPDHFHDVFSRDSTPSDGSQRSQRFSWSW